MASHSRKQGNIPMQKIKGTSTAAISNTDLNTIIEKGRGRDAHKARCELTRRERLKASMTVHRGPLDFACPHCGAVPGKQCMTAGGNVANNTHKARVALAD